jgi:membrane-bound serine protease (ClpP class)
MRRMHSLRSVVASLGRVPRALRLAAFAVMALVGAIALFLPPGAAQTEPEPDPGNAVVLDLDGAVTPATADYLTREMRRAADDGARLVVIRMDTPGGLDASMRDIIREILASPVPVATWVGPAGARAASAGTYILYASHVAAMAPGTNLGAATPVQIGGGGGSPFGGFGEDEDEAEAPAAEEVAEDDTTATDGAQADDGEAPGEEGRPARRFEPRTAAEAKVINDAVAYIRGLAELRDRNADWAELAVREAVSLGARQAADENVIDFTATSLDVLLERANGMEVQVGEDTVTLATAGLEIEEREMGLRTQILQIITDPNVALLLMVFGFYGIVFEIINPGTLIPGTIGAISLLTGFYALSVLPVNIAGGALMLLGVALLVAEAFAPSFGVLGIGGAIALTLGATLLIDTEAPGLEISWPIIGAIGVASLGFALLVARLAQTSHQRRIATGREEMIGSEAMVLEWSGTLGAVHVHGERWRAKSDRALSPGDRVAVVAVNGLTLDVRAPEAEPATAPD